MISTVAVLGAGNGGCAVAADLGARGYDVRIHSRTAVRLRPLAEQGGIVRRGACGEGFVPIGVITTDLRVAVEGADLVVLAAPASAHEHYADPLGAVMVGGQILLLNPGGTGGSLYFAERFRKSGADPGIGLGEVATLSHACRIVEPGVVNILRLIDWLPFAAWPGATQEKLQALLAPVFPAIAPAADVLETAFLNINAVEHPAQILCNAGWVEHTGGTYLFYYEGTTPAVGAVIDGVDAERRAVGEAWGVRTPPFAEIFGRMGYTTAEAARAGGAHAALQASAPNRWLTGPASLDHRYVHEDVGCGLVPWAALGARLDVATPVMDSLIVLASTMNERDYRREGLTLERLGIGGLTPGEVKTYLATGRKQLT